MAAPATEIRLRVAAVIPMDRGLVVVRHEKDGVAYHLLPGGGVEPGETLAAAVTREVREETGLACEPLRLLFVNDSIAPDSSRHMVQVTFLARTTGGALSQTSADRRVAGVRIVALGDLADLDLRPPMAAELAVAARNGYSQQARYLGPLWSDGSGLPSVADSSRRGTMGDSTRGAT